MKKIILALVACLFFCSSSQAADVQSRSEIEFLKGLSSFQDQDWKKSQQQFQKALKLNPKNQPALAFTSLSYLRQDNLKQAEAFINKALALDPKEPQSLLIQASILQKKGDLEGAKSSAQKAVAESPSRSPIKKEAQNLVRELSGKTPKSSEKRFSFFTSAMSFYDSNVSLNPDDIVLASLPSSSSSQALLIQARLTANLWRKKNDTLDAYAAYQHTFYTDGLLDKFNYGLWKAGLAKRLVRGRWAFGLTNEYDISMLGHVKYAQGWTAKAPVQIRMKEWWITSLTPKVRVQQIFGEPTTRPQDRDAWIIGFEGADTFLFGPGRKHALRLSASYERNEATGDSWDFNAWRAGANLKLVFPWEVELTSLVDVLIEKNFDSIDSLLGIERKDRGVSTQTALSRNVGNLFRASVFYGFTFNNSNSAFFEYKRHTVGAGLSRSF